MTTIERVPEVASPSSYFERAATPAPRPDAAGSFAMRYDVRPRHLLVSTSSGSPPRWLSPIASRIAQLSSLGPRWDGVDAAPLQPWAVEAAVNILARVMSVRSLAPQVVLTAGGGLQLEWHDRGVDLEIEVDALGSASVWFEDIGADDELDGSLAVHLDRVRTLLAQRLVEPVPSDA